MKTTKKPKVGGLGLEELLDRIDFQAENVVAEACDHPRLFAEAADYRMKRYRVRLETKAQYEEGRAAAALEVRRRSQKTETRMTEDNLKEILLCDPKLRTLRVQVDEAEVADEYSKLLLEAMRMRRDCLRVVADVSNSLSASRVLSQISMEQLSGAKEQLRKRFPGTEA